MNLALQTLAAVSLSVLAVAPAAAQQVSISYADLDVATQGSDGVERMRSRWARRARESFQDDGG